MQKIILLLAFILFNNVSAQTKKKQILLIGTFHFQNPGLDIAKTNTFNVMSEKSQKELENISEKIKKFGPDKIFVEWGYDKQDKLNKLYARNSDSLLGKKADERVQLALRTAKKLGHKKLYAIDYNKTHFPYDSLTKGMKEANQEDLMKKNLESTTQFEKSFNENIKKYNLTELLIDFNTKKFINQDLQWYMETALRAGKTDNFVGAFLVSEWYKRNLYMYSLIQKLTDSKDEKIMVLLGASHAAIIRDFIAHDPTFEIVELSTVLK
ncbi:DUF5694 domain-containing protein [Flavobacterium sp. HJSW_4]|uniref:DUF5694 domain-containing protein n=1 Tax=Flavobacterium sp. HJSW_4 TaxID=3344660 RepID=UPI0035F4AA3F